MIQRSLDNRSRKELLTEIEQLRVRLDEAEQTLEAIHSGDVDALVVAGPQGDRIFSLSGAESIYRLIYETMNEAALTVALDGTILFCNQRFCELMKSSMEDCVGSRLDRFVAPAQLQPLKNLLADATTGPFVRHIALQTAVGSSISMQISVSTILDDANICICLLATDLTALELQAGSIDTMIKRQQALEKNQAELNEVNVSLRNSRMAALNLMQDAVESRRQFEESTRLLRKSEQRIQQALDVSRSFTFDWHPISDLVIRSASCGKILNVTGDEAVNDTGERYFQRIHPEDRAGFVQILHALSPAADCYTTEYRVICPDGIEIVLEETGHGAFYADGTLERLVGVSTDITARKVAEEALQRANNELEQRVKDRTMDLEITLESLQAETVERLKVMDELLKQEQMLLQQSRLAAMGEMINNIAHQWRQPLNSLGLLIQKLPMFYDSAAFNREFLEHNTAKAMKLIQHMSQTINDFRDFFRIDKVMVSFSLDTVIRQAVAFIEQAFRDLKIKLDLRIDKSLMVRGYPNEYAQSLLNILMNSRDALVENYIDNARIELRAFVQDGTSVVTITDNAGGIPDEIIDKVFDPYFSTKGPDKGTGLGLFMSKTIIEKNMSGRLSVCNSATGVEFRIEVECGE